MYNQSKMGFLCLETFLIVFVVITSCPLIVSICLHTTGCLCREDAGSQFGDLIDEITTSLMSQETPFLIHPLHTFCKHLHCGKVIVRSLIHDHHADACIL